MAKRKLKLKKGSKNNELPIDNGLPKAYWGAILNTVLPQLTGLAGAGAGAMTGATAGMATGAGTGLGSLTSATGGGLSSLGTGASTMGATGAGNGLGSMDVNNQTQVSLGKFGKGLQTVGKGLSGPLGPLASATTKAVAEMVNAFITPEENYRTTLKNTGAHYANGGEINIKPSKKGTFTKAAKQRGMGVQQFASKVLANKDNYSPAMVKKANFARNAAKWKKAMGGIVEPEIFEMGGLTGTYMDAFDAMGYGGNVYDHPDYSDYMALGGMTGVDPTKPPMYSWSTGSVPAMGSKIQNTQNSSISKTIPSVIYEGRTFPEVEVNARNLSNPVDTFTNAYKNKPLGKDAFPWKYTDETMIDDGYGYGHNNMWMSNDIGLDNYKKSNKENKATVTGHIDDIMNNYDERKNENPSLYLIKKNLNLPNQKKYSGQTSEQGLYQGDYFENEKNYINKNIKSKGYTYQDISGDNNLIQSFTPEQDTLLGSITLTPEMWKDIYSSKSDKEAKQKLFKMANVSPEEQKNFDNTFIHMNLNNPKQLNTYKKAKSKLPNTNWDASKSRPMALGGTMGGGNPIIPPTASDSLAVYNKAIELNNYYKNKGYDLINHYDSYYKSSNDLINELNNQSNEFVNQDKVTYPTKNGSSNQGKLNLSYYRKPQDPNKPYIIEQREIASRILDTRAPFGYYDTRILPQSQTIYQNNNPHDPLYNDGVNIINYDPIAVKPYTMRTPAEHKEFQKKYGNYKNNNTTNISSKIPEVPQMQYKDTIAGQLESMGIKPTFENRKKLAEEYGLNNYSGSMDQNVKLLQLVKFGKKPNTENITSVTPNVNLQKGNVKNNSINNNVIPTTVTPKRTVPVTDIRHDVKKYFKTYDDLDLKQQHENTYIEFLRSGTLTGPEASNLSPTQLLDMAKKWKAQQGMAYGGMVDPLMAFGGMIDPTMAMQQMMYGSYAQGGQVPQNIPVEVEGEEMYEMPNGQTGEFSGPKHENGGIPIALPEGTKIYSDRLKVNGKTMAQRKDKREANINKLEKLLTKNPNDKFIKEALKRQQETAALEEQGDMQMQEQANQQQQMEEMAMEEMLMGAAMQDMQEGMMAMGGMIKRADGSYSKRGLWDNIRANRGSGKKPTKEMLAQEKKIKSQEMGMGGILGNDSYSINMPRYGNGTPPQGTGDVYKNMLKGDQGKYYRNYKNQWYSYDENTGGDWTPIDKKDQVHKALNMATLTKEGRSTKYTYPTPNYNPIAMQTLNSNNINFKGNSNYTPTFEQSVPRMSYNSLTPNQLVETEDGEMMLNPFEYPESYNQPLSPFSYTFPYVQGSANNAQPVNNYINSEPVTENNPNVTFPLSQRLAEASKKFNPTISDFNESDIVSPENVESARTMPSLSNEISPSYTYNEVQQKQNRPNFFNNLMDNISDIDLSNMFNRKPRKDKTNQTTTGKTTKTNNVSGDNVTYTEGDITGMAGTAVGMYGPSLMTLLNRMETPPNQNFYNTYGQDALKTQMEAEGIAGQAKDEAYRKNVMRANALRNAIANSARGVGDMRTQQLTAALTEQEGARDILGSYLQSMAGLKGQRANLQAQIDQTRMGGEYQRDLADRQDVDQFYTNLAQNLTGVSEGTQKMGRDKNIAKRNKDILSLSKYYSSYGIYADYDDRGNLVLKDQSTNKVKSDKEIEKLKEEIEKLKKEKE